MDYRYFRIPDLLPVRLDETFIEEVTRNMPCPARRSIALFVTTTSLNRMPSY
ncbi:MAG: hypothetical protein U5O39_19265 [Gammaproteobacteria bacterium]|nr:hypothetical protein [Gammaproteobacteria bacterium]